MGQAHEEKWGLGRHPESYVQGNNYPRTPHDGGGSGDKQEFSRREIRTPPEDPGSTAWRGRQQKDRARGFAPSPKRASEIQLKQSSTCDHGSSYEAPGDESSKRRQGAIRESAEAQLGSAVGARWWQRPEQQRRRGTVAIAGSPTGFRKRERSRRERRQRERQDERKIGEEHCQGVVPLNPYMAEPPPRQFPVRHWTLVPDHHCLEIMKDDSWRKCRASPSLSKPTDACVRAQIAISPYIMTQCERAWPNQRGIWRRYKFPLRPPHSLYSLDSTEEFSQISFSRTLEPLRPSVTRDRVVPCSPDVENSWCITAVAPCGLVMLRAHQIAPVDLSKVPLRRGGGPLVAQAKLRLCRLIYLPDSGPLSPYPQPQYGWFRSDYPRPDYTWGASRSRVVTLLQLEPSLVSGPLLQRLSGLMLGNHEASTAATEMSVVELLPDPGLPGPEDMSLGREVKAAVTETSTKHPVLCRKPLAFLIWLGIILPRCTAGRLNRDDFEKKSWYEAPYYFGIQRCQIRTTCWNPRNEAGRVAQASCYFCGRLACRTCVVLRRPQPSATGISVCVHCFHARRHENLANRMTRQRPSTSEETRNVRARGLPISSEVNAEAVPSASSENPNNLMVSHGPPVEGSSAGAPLPPPLAALGHHLGEGDAYPVSTPLIMEQVIARTHRECRVQLGCQPDERMPAVAQCRICLDSACTWCTTREQLRELNGHTLALDLCYRCLFACRSRQRQVPEFRAPLPLQRPSRPPPLSIPCSCRVLLVCRAVPPAGATSRCFLCWDPSCELCLVRQPLPGREVRLCFRCFGTRSPNPNGVARLINATRQLASLDADALNALRRVEQSCIQPRSSIG